MAEILHFEILRKHGQTNTQTHKQTHKHTNRHGHYNTSPSPCGGRGNNKSKNKLITYRTFKLDHKQELYLTKIKDTHIRSSVEKMRLSNHHLMIEKGRHMGLDLDKRICTKCNLNVIED